MFKLEVGLVSLLLTLNIYFSPFSSTSVVDFEQVDICWVGLFTCHYLSGLSKKLPMHVCSRENKGRVY